VAERRHPLGPRGAGALAAAGAAGLTGPDRSGVTVVGAGPNGLAAAIALAREGHAVRVLEAQDVAGGGSRSAELTLPGFVHDVCSAIHPLAAGSPFFSELPLAAHGLEWIHPDLPLAHPLDDGTAVAVHRSLDDTVKDLGRDGAMYRRVFGPLAERWPSLLADVQRPPLHVPRHPILFGGFGVGALMPARVLIGAAFRGERTRAVLAGLAAHSFLPFGSPFGGSFTLLLTASIHGVGWPLARGGSQRIADALVAHLRSLGGTVETGHRVASLGELDPPGVTMLDVTPRQLERIAGDRLPDRYRRALRRYRYGPGVFKLDYALSGPVPWRAPECRRAGTVHLGGSFEEIAAGESAVARGEHPERPFVLVAQQSLCDPSRAPAGRHTLWAYCHVPNGSAVDMTDRIERQLERFAPGFRDLVLARSAMACADVERHDENCVGGDISGGAHDGLQLVFRPVMGFIPYATPARDVYLCSSSTPPGGGVHGMCGYWAARAALRRSFA